MDVKVKLRYTAVLPTAADGNFPFLASDSRGRILISPSTLGGSPAPYDSAGVATSLVVKAAAGVLYSVFGYNNAVATRFIQLFDLAAVGADGAAPDFAPIAVPAGSNFALTFTKGWVAGTGIVLVSSTTLLTKTITVGADVWFSGEFE